MPQIIAAIDFSQLTDLVIEQSERLARAFQCSITLLHVAAPNPEFVGYEAGPQSVRDARASELAEEHQELVRQAEGLTARGLDARALLISGPTVDKILEEADRHETRYIVLGSHGHGKVYEVLVGSVCDGVVRRAACPIVIVPYRAVSPRCRGMNRFVNPFELASVDLGHLGIVSRRPPTFDLST